ncbi:MAG: CPBP family intramembrane glutamic endopeptidase [Anaerolineales bacterium]
MDEETIRIVLLVIAFSLLMIGGFLRRPGIGILFCLIAIGYISWSEPAGLTQFGLAAERNWWTTVGLGILIGTLLAIISMAVLEPFVEGLTGRVHDISIVEGVRGNLAGFLRWLLVVWVFVATLEELVFRGYLMREFVWLAGHSTVSIAVALILSSAAFGLSHLYQGISGGLSSAVIGLILGAIYLASGFNLWLLIIIHGVIDTVQIGLIFADKDEDIRNWFPALRG